MSDTRDKILDTAEKLFADLGVDGASLRAITDAAGVNLGSIHYYFKTKDQLVAEVLARRIDQYNREGAAQLAAMKKYNLRPPVRDIWLIMTNSLLGFRNQHPDYIKFMQQLLVIKEQMVYEILLNKTDEYEEDFLELLSGYFIPQKRDKALARCRVLLMMLYKTVLNYNLVALYMERHGIQRSDAEIAGDFADIAVSALNEFMED